MIFLIIYIITSLTSFLILRYSYKYIGAKPDLSDVIGLFIPIVNLISTGMALYMFVIQDKTKEFSKKFFKL